MDEQTIQAEAFFTKVNQLVVAAIADAVALNRKLGVPIYISRDGRIVDISQEVDSEIRSDQP